LARDWDGEEVILNPFIRAAKIFLFYQRVDSVVKNEE
jgi:hypothetical protein